MKLEIFQLGEFFEVFDWESKMTLYASESEENCSSVKFSLETGTPTSLLQ